MTPNQFRAAIKALGLSQERAGVFFGYQARQGQRWAAPKSVKSHQPVPPAVAMLIRLMLRHGHKPEDVK